MISICKDLVRANDFLGTFFVITEPAPTILSFSIVIGATNEELDPINTLSLIFVSWQKYFKEIICELIKLYT